MVGLWRRIPNVSYVIATTMLIEIVPTGALYVAVLQLNFAFFTQPWHWCATLWPSVSFVIWFHFHWWNFGEEWLAWLCGVWLNENLVLRNYLSKKGHLQKLQIIHKRKPNLPKCRWMYSVESVWRFWRCWRPAASLMASPAGTGICRLIVTNFIHGGDVDDDDEWWWWWWLWW